MMFADVDPRCTLAIAVFCFLVVVAVVIVAGKRDRW